VLALPGLVATLFTTSKEASARSDQLHHIRSGPIQQTTEAFSQFAKDLLRPDASTAVQARTFLTALHATKKPIFNFNGALKDPAEALVELQDVLDPTLFEAIQVPQVSTTKCGHCCAHNSTAIPDDPFVTLKITNGQSIQQAIDAHLAAELIPEFKCGNQSCKTRRATGTPLPDMSKTTSFVEGMQGIILKMWPQGPKSSCTDFEAMAERLQVHINPTLDIPLGSPENAHIRSFKLTAFVAYKHKHCTAVILEDKNTNSWTQYSDTKVTHWKGHNHGFGFPSLLFYRLEDGICQDRGATPSVQAQVLARPSHAMQAAPAEEWQVVPSRKQRSTHAGAGTSESDDSGSEAKRAFKESRTSGGVSERERRAGAVRASAWLPEAPHKGLKEGRPSARVPEAAHAEEWQVVPSRKQRPTHAGAATGESNDSGNEAKRALKESRTSCGVLERERRAGAVRASALLLEAPHKVSKEERPSARAQEGERCSSGEPPVCARTRSKAKTSTCDHAPPQSQVSDSETSEMTKTPPSSSAPTRPTTRRSGSVASASASPRGRDPAPSSVSASGTSEVLRTPSPSSAQTPARGKADNPLARLMQQLSAPSPEASPQGDRNGRSTHGAAVVGNSPRLETPSVPRSRDRGTAAAREFPPPPPLTSNWSHSYIINNQAQIPTSVGQRPLDIFLVQKSVRHKLYK